MKKRRFFLVLSVLLILGAGIAVFLYNLGSLFQSEAERDAAARENPRFWKYTSAVPDAGNLYILNNDLFTGKPYNDLYLFGSDILLVGEAYYDDAIDAGLSVSDTEELVYEYSFEVYSPWRNRIVHTLRHQDITCDSYQVVGDLLFLFNEEAKELSVYDTSLTLTGVYDISPLYDTCTPEFYATGSPSVFYACDSSAGTLLQVTFTEDSIDISALSSPYYGTVPGGASDGMLAVSGVDPVTLGYRIAVLDTDSLLPLYEAPGYGAFTGDVSGSAWIGRTNYSESYWIYQPFDGDANYFQFPDAQRAYLLADGGFLLEQEDYEHEVSDYVISYYRYASDGTAISSFSYSCGDYGSLDCTFLSLGLAYFPEEQLCFILAYNANCEPYLLVWDTSVSGENMAPLDFYPSEEELSLHTPALSYEEYESLTGLSYGSTITLIADPDSYDWGALADATETASRLEALYGISIYIGPEVPDRIDCFSVEQRTDAASVEAALSDLEAVLSCYPQNFFRQLCFGENRGIRFYLSGTISGDTEGMLEDPSGFVNEINSYMVMVLDIDASWNWDYTINHELSHMVDRRLAFRFNYADDALFSEEAWAAYNPEDCEYLNSYEGYTHYAVYDRYAEYFIDSYGLTFATEDRAELFGTAMSDYLNNFAEDRFFDAGTPTAEKYAFYCACIRDGFDTSGWDSVTPWEEVLRK